MPGIIKRPNAEKEAATEKPDLHTVLLRLDSEDRDKLKHLCRLGDTNQNDILRQCLRHVYEAEMRDIRASKSGAA